MKGRNIAYIVGAFIASGIIVGTTVYKLTRNKFEVDRMVNINVNDEGPIVAGLINRDGFSAGPDFFYPGDRPYEFLKEEEYLKRYPENEGNTFFIFNNNKHKEN